MTDKSRTPSFGAVIIEKTDRGHLVLMVGGYHGWSFPKGHQEPGELPEETAVREIKEETGIDAVIDTSFSRTVASALKKDDRSVTFFLGTSPAGTVTPIAQPEEVGYAEWMPIQDALEGITYDPDRHVLEDALEHLGISYRHPLTM